MLCRGDKLLWVNKSLGVKTRSGKNTLDRSKAKQHRRPVMFAPAHLELPVSLGLLDCERKLEKPTKTGE